MSQGPEFLSTCRHYVWSGDVCKAGVKFAEVTPDWDNNKGRYFRQPCHVFEPASLSPVQAEQAARKGACAKHEPLGVQPPTPAVDVNEVKLEIIKQVKEHAPKNRHWSKSVQCPVCSKALALTRVKSGKLMAMCETDGCLNFSANTE